MKKQNDIILISVVMIIVLSIVLVSVSINLILVENEMIQEIRKLEEIHVEKIKGKETRITTKIDNTYE